MSQEQTLSTARPPFIAIAMLSFAALSYEVLLTRLFSIIQWHHFAYMIISVALLGYGASGALITIFQDWIKNQVKTLFVINIALFSVFSVVCFFIAQALPFSPLEILWDTNQWVWLFLVYLCLFLPFLFAATSLGLVYRFFYYRIGPAYAADLFGAGIGALGIIVVLFILSPTQALIFISSIGFLAAIVACFELKINGLVSWLLVLLLFASWSIPEHWLVLVPSIYKAESQTLNIKGTKIIEHRSSPLGLLNVVESPDVPFRYAPGLSLNADTELPSQIAIFTDGDSMTVVNRVEGDVNDNRESLQFISHMMSALPYQILHKPDVLVLGAGGGTDVLQGLYYQARHIDAVELNPQVVDLVSKKYAEYSGNIYDNKSVDLHVADARAYVNRSDEHYDLIQLALLDSFNASSAGLYSLNESYLYTVEAVAALARAWEMALPSMSDPTIGKGSSGLTACSNSARTCFKSLSSYSFQRPNPKDCRPRPGAMCRAIMAASMRNVPEPHMASTSGEVLSQPVSWRMPAASTSLIGAWPRSTR